MEPKHKNRGISLCFYVATAMMHHSGRLKEKIGARKNQKNVEVAFVRGRPQVSIIFDEIKL